MPVTLTDLACGTHFRTLSHYTYTLPPTVVLAILAYPLLTRKDALKLAILIFIAVVSTTPWDAWIISEGAWTYPAGTVLGTCWGIPYEEFAFFGIRTFAVFAFGRVRRPESTILAW